MLVVVVEVVEQEVARATGQRHGKGGGQSARGLHFPRPGGDGLAGVRALGVVPHAQSEAPRLVLASIFLVSFSSSTYGLRLLHTAGLHHGHGFILVWRIAFAQC